MTKHHHTIIIGAGLSGLSAAWHLQQQGKTVLVLEASHSVGGRIKTEIHAGFRLDVGFQVLLTHYPEAQKMLDYDALDLKYFDNGALIFNAGSTFSITDPFRQPATAIKMLFSPVGTLKDKILLAKLLFLLRKKSVTQIFAAPETTTALALKKAGFSPKIIQNFFEPFFRGIFLENTLSTSSRMFEFVLKLFAQGSTAIPNQGMQAIPHQIAAKLQPDTIVFGKKAMEINEGAVATQDGEIFTAQNIVIATQANNPLLKNHEQPHYQAHGSVTNVYFSAEKSPLNAPILALNAEKNGFVNNICVLSDVAPEYAPAGMHLISVSINGIFDELDEAELVQRIKSELAVSFGYEVNTWDLLKIYAIPHALPNQQTVTNNAEPAQLQIGENLYKCGDYMLNASINAALKVGRQTAELILKNEN